MRRLFVIAVLAAISLAVLVTLRVDDDRTGDSSADRTGESSAPAGVRADSQRGPANARNAEIDTDPVSAGWAGCAGDIRDELPAALAGLGAGRTPPIVDMLSASGSAEHVLAGALLRPGSERDAIRRDIERALALDGDHPLVLWHALYLCDNRGGGGYCNSDGFLRTVHEHLDGNAAFWSRRAIAAIADDREAAALAALQRAAVAPEFDAYADEHMMLFERALALSGDLPYALRASLAYGLASTVPGPAYGLSRICKDRAAADSLWLDACLGWAARLAGDGRTVFDLLIGNGLLASMYELAGREWLAADAVARGDELRELVNEGPAWEVPVMRDDRFAARFFDEFTTNGEIAAIRFAGDELDRLGSDPGYDPCVLAGPRTPDGAP